jgi:hypothetical protein
MRLKEHFSTDQDKTSSENSSKETEEIRAGKNKE